MDTIDIFFGVGLLLPVGCLIRGVIKSYKEDKRKENTPIYVYKYTYKVYLSDGSRYEKLANLYVNYDFNDFVKLDILHKGGLKINGSLVVNTEQIVKVELINMIHKQIRPILNEFGIDRIYNDKEVEEREFE